MKFFKNAVKIFKETMTEDQQSSVRTFKLTFGVDYMEKIEEITELLRAGEWQGGNSIEVDFDQNLLIEINDCVETHSGNSRILYSEEMQFLDVVGEGFRQDDLKNLYNKMQDQWLSGVLMPEPLNPHDSNAVSVLVIFPERSSEDPSQQFAVIQAGYLKKDQARKVSKKLNELAKSDRYIPVLCKLVGGTLDKPNLGLLARAKTSQIEF